MDKRIEQLEQDDLAPEQQKAFSRLVMHVKEQLQMPTLPNSLMILLISVFTLVGISSCSKADDEFKDAHIINVDPDATSCKNEDGVMELDIRIHKDDGILLNDFRIELNDDGEDNNWTYTFRDTNGEEHVITDDTQAKDYLVTGDIDGTLSVPGGNEETDFFAYWKDDHNQAFLLEENIGCGQTFDGYEFTDYDIISCSNDGTVMVLQGRLIVQGDEQDNVLDNMSVTTTEASNNWNVTVGGVSFSNGTGERDVPIGSGTIPFTATLPNGTPTSDIRFQYTSEGSGGDEQKSFTVANEGCEVVCPQWNPQLTYKNLVNHCKFEMTIDLDGCTAFTDVIRMGYAGPHIHHVNFEIFFTNGSKKNIEAVSNDFSYDIRSKNIDYIKITHVADLPGLHSGDIVSFRIFNEETQQWETKIVTI